MIQNLFYKFIIKLCIRTVHIEYRLIINYQSSPKFSGYARSRRVRQLSDSCLAPRDLSKGEKLKH